MGLGGAREAGCGVSAEPKDAGGNPLLFNMVQWKVHRVTPRRANARGRGHHRMDGDRMTDCSTPPHYPTIRVNLLRAHGSPTQYWYAKGCRCVACRGARSAYNAAYQAEHQGERAVYAVDYRAANHERVLAADRARYAAEAEHRREYARLYYQDGRAHVDAESQKARSAAGRARLKSVTSQLMCVDCAAFGIKLHFHHRDPATKTTQVSSLSTCRWDRVLEEIAKCDPLCVKCHHGRHDTEGRRDKSSGQYGSVPVEHSSGPVGP